MPRPKTGRVQLGANPYVNTELRALCHHRRITQGTPYGKTLEHLHQLAKESSKYYTTQPTEPNETNS